MSDDPSKETVVVKCADHLHEIWKSNKSSKLYVKVLTVLLFPVLVTPRGGWQWLMVIPFAVVFIANFRSLLTIQRGSKTFPCPVCGGTGNLLMGRPVKLQCPACQKVYPTDATLPLAGNRPEKIPHSIPWPDSKKW